MSAGDPCQFAGCDRSVAWGELCPGHRRQRQRGHELTPLRPQRREVPLAELVAKAAPLWEAGWQVRDIATKLDIGPSRMSVVMAEITENTRAHASTPGMGHGQPARVASGCVCVVCNNARLSQRFPATPPSKSG